MVAFFIDIAPPLESHEIASCDIFDDPEIEGNAHSSEEELVGAIQEETGERESKSVDKYVRKLRPLKKKCKTTA